MQPMAWKEYCVEFWLKEFQESMDRCTYHCDVTNTVANRVKHHTINQSLIRHLLKSVCKFTLKLQVGKHHIKEYGQSSAKVGRCGQILGGVAVKT